MAMAGKCSGLDEGTPIFDIDVYCPQLSARFSHQLSKLLMASSYNGSAVSIQNNGTIISCGRLEIHFPVLASYNKQIILHQNSPYHPTEIVSWWTLQRKFYLYTILEGNTGTCSSNADIFDPWNPPPENIGNDTTPDQFPVGDLTNRWRYSPYIDVTVPLIGNATILGHAVCKDYNSLK